MKQIGLIAAAVAVIFYVAGDPNAAAAQVHQLGDLVMWLVDAVAAFGRALTSS